MKSLGIDDSAPIRLTNEYRPILVEAKLNPNCFKGFGFMPASQLIDSLASYDPTKAKRPNTKCIEVIVEPVY
ncbi:MAG: hypothetical protein SWO11_02805 [Thermodesulfobacteriota bacterium]|nr:hypothetical protein [Thermodesulfobacteriota bacterium]